MTLIVEKRLRFEFGPSWQSVTKYDAHPAYRERVERLKGKIVCQECSGKLLCQDCKREPDVDSKAVDIVGRHNNRLYLIEIKDFRGRRLSDGLAIQVARKVRDTVAVLVGALHGPNAPSWRPLVEPMFQWHPHVVLWLEEDLRPTRDEPGDKRRTRIEDRGHMALDIDEPLRKYLRWLTPKVMVVNQQKLWPELDLKVHRIPDHVYELREIMNKPQRISLDDYCRVMDVTRQAAGKHLDKLCEERFLRREGDWYARGPRWDQFHGEPAEPSR